MNRLLIAAPIAAALTVLAGCTQPQPPAGPARVEAANATCRPTIGPRRMTGCYLVLTASEDDRLVSVMTPMAREAQIHEMAMEGDVMRMRELKDGLPLPAGETVRLQPGGNHLMLLDTRGPLEVGQTVPLALTFEKAAPVTVLATVGQPGGHGG